MIQPMIEPLVLFFIGQGVIALRTYTRVNVVGWRHLDIDDYLMLIVAVLYTGGIGVGFVITDHWHGLNNGGMTPEQRLSLDPNSDEYSWRVNGSKAYVAIWVLFSLVLWLQKGAMLAFFIRLTAPLGDYTKRIYFGFAFVGLSYMLIILYFFLDCLPLERTWQIYPDPGNSCVPSDIATLSLVLSMNILTDVYILAIPLPLFWMAHTKLWKKLGLMVLIGGNVFIIIVAIVRVVLILGDPVTGPAQAAPWSYRVMFVSVITTNAPLLAPLIRRKCVFISRKLFGEKSAEDCMMRQIQTITSSDDVDQVRLDSSFHESIYRDPLAMVARQGRRPSAATSGNKTLVAIDDCERVKKDEAGIDLELLSERRRSLSDEYPV